MRWHFHRHAFRPLLSPFTLAGDENPLVCQTATHSFIFAHLISEFLLLVKHIKASIILAPCCDCILVKKSLFSKWYYLTLAEEVAAAWLL